MALGQPAAAQFTTIFRTDYDLLQAAVQLLLVGTQTTPGVLDRGKGYGQTLASLTSKQFPFAHTITSITNSSPAVINTATDHNYRVGDIILINSLSTGNAIWDTSGLSNQYFKVAASPVPGARSFGIQNVAGGPVDTRSIAGFPTMACWKNRYSVSNRLCRLLNLLIYETT